MSNSLTTPTDQTKSLKDRLTFNWPTRSTLLTGKPTQVITPFNETKLPVKQRVVFPSGRFDSDNNLNDNNGQSNKGNRGNNNQRSHSDESWESMADIFRNPSSSNPWTNGPDKNNDNTNNGNDNNINNNKKRRSDQNFKSRDNYNSRRNNVDGEFSGYGNNSNNRNKWQNKRRSIDWEFDDNRKRRNSDNDHLVIDWSVDTNQIKYPNYTIDSTKLPKKSIATQTDFSSSSRSIGVQTDSCDYFIPMERKYFYYQPDYLHNQLPVDTINFQHSNGINHREDEATIIDKNDQQPSGPLIIPCANEDTSNGGNRDPRVARRARNAQQN